MGKEEKDTVGKSRSGIIVVDKLPFHIADDDPVIVRKQQETIKSFKETPWPDFIIKRFDIKLEE